MTSSIETAIPSIHQNDSESNSISDKHIQHQSLKTFLLIENPKKSNNLGPILRCAAAYAIHQVIFVGYQKCSVHGSHGASKHLNIISFPTFDQAITYLKKDCNVQSIIGIMGGGSGDAFYKHDGVFLKEWQVENVFVLDSKTNNTKEPNDSKIQRNVSYPIHIRPFLRTYDKQSNHLIKYNTNDENEFQLVPNKNFCFVISKHPKGFPFSHKNICDSFVHIPYVDIHTKINQHENTSSSTTIPIQNESSLPIALMDSYIPPYRYIDVQSCLSITLHHFTSWMQTHEQKNHCYNTFHERSFEQYKFKVNPANERYQTAQNLRERETKNRSQKRKQDKFDAEHAVEDALGFMADLGL